MRWWACGVVILTHLHLLLPWGSHGNQLNLVKWMSYMKYHYRYVHVHKCKLKVRTSTKSKVTRNYSTAKKSIMVFVVPVRMKNLQSWA